MKYGDAFSRNIGLFTETEQSALKNATVLVAGLGGVGGIQAAILARFGVGNLILIDPGNFDPPDINRQYGATSSTMGKNKAECTAAMLKDINPFLEVEYHTDKPSTDLLKNLVTKSSLVVDAIDYSELQHKVLLAKAARSESVFNLSSPIPDFAALLMIFDPEGMTLEEFYDVPEDPLLWIDFKVGPEKFFGGRPYPQNITDFLDGRTNYISTNAGAAALSGALLATEAAFLLSGKRPHSSIVRVPEVVYIDLFQREYSVFNPQKNLKEQ